MKFLTAVVCFGVFALGACSKGSNVRTCNPGTLLLSFNCADDLAAANGLTFQVRRDDGARVEFVTKSLSCPGTLVYEVALTNYSSAQQFEVSASPTASGVAVGEPNVLSDISLAQGCTALAVPLTAAGGRMMVGSGVDAAIDGASIPIERGSLESGVACTIGPECMSGFCADGVCCDGTCSGTCEACNLQGSSGQCMPTPDGQLPANGKTCTAEAASSCGLDGKCNGQGGCRNWPDGTVCAAGICEGAGTRGRKTCSAGACTADKDLGCAPFACNAETVACFEGCTSSEMCAAGKACTTDPDTTKKSCGKKPLGAVCGTGPECESGQCADGVCCSTSCQGACRSCNLVGTAGECKSLPAGSDDVRKVCKATDMSTCGQTGKCDGGGGCAQFAKGSVCLAAKCVANEGVPASECDGNGGCVSAGPIACAPFTCGGNACLTKCTTNEQCTGGTSCVNGSCGLLPKGAICSTASACASGFCADGVCCDSACNGTCQFCASTSTKGTCADVAAGADDPRNKCVAGSPASCGNNGKCNGQKGCEQWPAGTECLARSCDASANSESFAKQCNGSGGCVVAKPAASCAPFTCSGNACGTTCSRDDQCVAPNVCSNGVCGKRRNGLACGNASQCASGVCAQGVCCSSDCSGTCKSCAVPGKEGTCEGTTGADAACSASTCGYTGQCLSGSCQAVATGTQCAAASCSGNTRTAARSCSGFGQCGAATPEVCPKFLTCLDGSNCRSSCGSTSDCTDGRQCWQGECMRKMTVSLDFDKATSDTVYQDGSVETFYFGAIYVGDVPANSHPLLYRRGFLSWKIGKLPVDTKKILTARFKVGIFNSGGDFGGNLRDLGPLVVEHVRYDILGIGAFNAQPFTTLGVPGALTSTLVVPSFGPNENVVLEVGSAVEHEFFYHTHVQFRFRSAGKDTNNDGSYDGMTLYVAGSSLEIDILRP